MTENHFKVTKLGLCVLQDWNYILKNISKILYATKNGEAQWFNLNQAKMSMN